MYLLSRKEREEVCKFIKEQFVMECLNTNNSIFLLFYFSDFILIFFFLFFQFYFG